MKIQQIREDIKQIICTHLEDIIIASIIFVTAFTFRIWHITKIGWVTDDGVIKLDSIYNDNTVFHSSDTDIYTNLAKRLLRGEGMDVPFAPPLTSIIIAVIYFLSGFNYYIVKLYLCAFGAVTSVLSYFIGKELFDDKNIGILTGILSSISFGLIMTSGALNTEIFYSTLHSITLLLMLRYLKYRSCIAGLIPVGIFAGLTALTRTEYLLFLSIFIIYIMVKDNIKHTVKKILVLIIIVSAIISPWAIRNYLFMNRFNAKYPSVAEGLPVFVPFSLNGPLNFAEGNNPLANGTYNPAFLGDSKIDTVFLDLNNTVHKRYILHGYLEGFRFLINTTPAYIIKLLWKKLMVFINSFNYGFLNLNYPVGVVGYRLNKADCFIPNHNLMFFINTISFLSGIIIAKTHFRKPYSIFPLYMVIATLITNILFYGLTRSGLPILNLILLYESVFLAWVLYKIFSIIVARYSNIYSYSVKYANSLRVIALCVLSACLIYAGYIETNPYIMIKERQLTNSNTIILKRIRVN